MTHTIRQKILLTLSRIYELKHFPPFDKAGFLETFKKIRNQGCPRLGRTDAERSDDRKRRLLRARPTTVLLKQQFLE
jgi:hypothetical protein